MLIPVLKDYHSELKLTNNILLYIQVLRMCEPVKVGKSSLFLRYIGLLAKLFADLSPHS